MTPRNPFEEVPLRRVRVTLEFDSADSLTFLRRACELCVRDEDGLPSVVMQGRCFLNPRLQLDNLRRVSVSEVAP